MEQGNRPKDATIRIYYNLEHGDYIACGTCGTKSWKASIPTAKGEDLIDELAVVAMREAGEKNIYIASVLGISPDLVSKIAKRWGRAKPRGRPFTKAKK
jgi:hypothetical protein